MTAPVRDDYLAIVPDDIDLSRSPMAGQLPLETYVLGAFNPGMTRLPNGNLLLMVRVAEALREPAQANNVHAIRWADGRYVLDSWPLADVDQSDPRTFRVRGMNWTVLALTSLSWLLPVELTPDGGSIVAMHYQRAIAPQGDWQCYGIEDARISHVGDRWLMTTCSVSPERQATSLYSSTNGLDWQFEDVVLDHQNKDMLIFEGLIDGHYWALTRPLGDAYFAYPPGSRHRPMRCTGNRCARPACARRPGTPAAHGLAVAPHHWLRQMAGWCCGTGSNPIKAWASTAHTGRCSICMTRRSCWRGALNLCWKPRRN
jgi:hypothetical protein